MCDCLSLHVKLIVSVSYLIIWFSCRSHQLCGCWTILPCEQTLCGHTGWPTLAHCSTSTSDVTLGPTSEQRRLQSCLRCIIKTGQRNTFFWFWIDVWYSLWTASLSSLIWNILLFSTVSTVSLYSYIIFCLCRYIYGKEMVRNVITIQMEGIQKEEDVGVRTAAVNLLVHIALTQKSEVVPDILVLLENVRTQLLSYKSLWEYESRHYLEVIYFYALFILSLGLLREWNSLIFLIGLPQTLTKTMVSITFQIWEALVLKKVGLGAVLQVQSE